MAKPTYLDLSPAAVKARAAGALNSLPGGDTRPGVACRAGHPDLPDIQWCPVPKGTFMMGSSRDDGDADSDEHGPEGEPFVVQVGAFDLAAYPMTVAQFEPFVEGDGYSNAEYWTDSGLEWLGGREEKQPYLWDDPEWNGRNQPVVGVSWYEAVAYCNWLTKRLDEAGELEDGRPVRLPTEEEWEYAARGPKGWKYPWGDKWNGNACNNEAAGIGTTCAVGLFPSGISQWLAEQDQIVHDLAGNVYEWCATKWRKSYEEKADESLSGDALRVIRGGAYFSSTGSVRCAYRYWDPPGEHGYGLLGFRCAR